jgi:hypothetical protein
MMSDDCDWHNNYLQLLRTTGDVSKKDWFEYGFQVITCRTHTKNCSRSNVLTLEEKNHSTVSVTLVGLA